MSQRNAAALSAEFDSQAEEEAALGLPVSVVQAHDAASKARMELSFINVRAAASMSKALVLTSVSFSRVSQFVVRPLFKTLADSVPRLAFTLARIDANVAAWSAHAARA